jgi:hypothetical protein
MMGTRTVTREPSRTDPDCVITTHGRAMWQPRVGEARRWYFDDTYARVWAVECPSGGGPDLHHSSDAAALIGLESRESVELSLPEIVRAVVYASRYVNVAGAVRWQPVADAGKCLWLGGAGLQDAWSVYRPPGMSPALYRSEWRAKRKGARRRRKAERRTFVRDL